MRGDTTTLGTDLRSRMIFWRSTIRKLSVEIRGTKRFILSVQRALYVLDELNLDDRLNVTRFKIYQSEQAWRRFRSQQSDSGIAIALPLRKATLPKRVLAGYIAFAVVRCKGTEHSPREFANEDDFVESLVAVLAAMDQLGATETELSQLQYAAMPLFCRNFEDSWLEIAKTLVRRIVFIWTSHWKKTSYCGIQISGPNSWVTEVIESLRLIESTHYKDVIFNNISIVQLWWRESSRVEQSRGYSRVLVGETHGILGLVRTLAHEAYHVHLSSKGKDASLSQSEKEHACFSFQETVADAVIAANQALNKL